MRLDVSPPRVDLQLASLAGYSWQRRWSINFQPPGVRLPWVAVRPFASLVSDCWSGTGSPTSRFSQPEPRVEPGPNRLAQSPLAGAGSRSLRRATSRNDRSASGFGHRMQSRSTLRQSARPAVAGQAISRVVVVVCLRAYFARVPGEAPAALPAAPVWVSPWLAAHACSSAVGSARSFVRPLMLGRWATARASSSPSQAKADLRVVSGFGSRGSWSSALRLPLSLCSVTDLAAHAAQHGGKQWRDQVGRRRSGHLSPMTWRSILWIA
jgi:hypothetical protein